MATFRFRALASGVAAAIVVLALGISQPLAVAAASTFTFYAQELACFSLKGPASTTVDVTWRASDGTLKGSFEQMSQDTGFVTPPQDFCQTRRINAGDRIKAAAGTTSRTFKVPVLTAAFDRNTNIIKGRGVPGSILNIGIGSLRPNVPFDCETTVTVHSDGRYSKYVQGIPGGANCPADYDPIGGDVATLMWTSSHLDKVYRVAHAQAILITFGLSFVSGYMKPSQSATINLRDTYGTPLGTTTAHADGTGMFGPDVIRDGSGYSVDVQAWDIVTGNWAGSVAIQAPSMTFNVIIYYDEFNGTCMPNARYELVIADAGGDSHATGNTDSSGNTQFLAGTHRVHSGATMTITCLYATGDRITNSQVIP